MVDHEDWESGYTVIESERNRNGSGNRNGRGEQDEEDEESVVCGSGSAKGLDLENDLVVNDRGKFGNGLVDWVNGMVSGP